MDYYIIFFWLSSTNCYPCIQKIECWTRNITFPCNIIFTGPYEQIFDELEGDLSELLDNHTLDIETSGPYEQIFYGLQGDLSGLLDDHTLDIETSGSYEQIFDES